MSDLMKWMYAHYIRSYIESQPKDDGETMWFDLLENELGPLQRESLEAVTAFFAVQGVTLTVTMRLGSSPCFAAK